MVIRSKESECPIAGRILNSDLKREVFESCAADDVELPNQERIAARPSNLFLP